MCLSVIGKVRSIDKNKAVIDLDGAQQEASTVLKPQVKKGDYVLLHAGFIIEIMPAKVAKKALKDINETKTV